jgi:hypothetical protein
LHTRLCHAVGESGEAIPDFLANLSTELGL